MDDTTLKMTIAGFIHDIGKFADKDALGIDEKYVDANAAAYLPVKNGRYSHHHAVYTAGFLEQFSRYLPVEFAYPVWGDGDSLISLAAGHHNPGSALQWVIAESDRITSAWDRDKFDAEGEKGVAPRDYKKTRMLPLFEQLLTEEKNARDLFSYEYPLARLGPQSIFPLKRDESNKSDEKKEYRKLFDLFSEDLVRSNSAELSVEKWLDYFDGLMMLYTSSIPAARAGIVVPDISLYDHSRLTSAFSAAFYRYHLENDSLVEKAVRNRDEKKFLLISGNFYGIQPFIFKGYGESRRFRSKLLRGRSFYVSLLSELAIDLLCRGLSLPNVCAIFNAAGRFTVVAQNTQAALKNVDEASKIVNDWLLRKTFGETSVGLSFTEASLSDFGERRFSSLWDKISEGLEEKKFQKIDLNLYGGGVEGYLSQFKHGVCRLCGKRPASSHHGLLQDRSGEHLAVCGMCEDHVRIGSEVYRHSIVSILDKEKAKGILVEPIFDRYQIDFNDNLQALEGNDRGLLRLFDVSHDLEKPLLSGSGKRFMQGYVPRYEEGDPELSVESHDVFEEEDEIKIGEVKTLESIAQSALVRAPDKEKEGAPLLGVLKADVDQLGLLMGCGLPESKQSISRIASLSRQLNLFFAHYLPVLLAGDASFKNIYTVFAGGDDLFLIGPWNAIYALALQLRREFSRYVCGNEDIHFSAGLTLHKSHVPIDLLASSAEEALNSSKRGGRDRFTMFSQTTLWSDIDELEKVRFTFENWIQNQVLSKSMLYRINQFIQMAEQEQKILTLESIKSDDMNCMRWRALLAYAIARNVKQTEGDASINQIITTLAEWLNNFRGNLRIPLWHVLYTHR